MLILCLLQYKKQRKFNITPNFYQLTYWDEI